MGIPPHIARSQYTLNCLFSIYPYNALSGYKNKVFGQTTLPDGKKGRYRPVAAFLSAYYVRLQQI